MAAPQRTVIIAEDNDVTLQSLQKLLSKADFNVLPYKDQNTLNQSGYLQGVPCVLILGDMAGLDFLNFLKKAQWEMPVIFLHSGNSVTEAVRAIQLGAHDYLSKPFCSETLLTSINRAMKKAEQQAQLSATNQDLLRRATSLTRREWEIINLVLSGLLNKQIAERLGVALITVKVHRGSAMRKLGARTAAELARITQNLRFIPPNAITANGQTQSSVRRNRA